MASLLKLYTEMYFSKCKETNKELDMSKTLNKFEHSFREALKRERPKTVETAQDTLKK